MTLPSLGLLTLSSALLAAGPEPTEVTVLGVGEGWSAAVSNNGIVAGSNTATAEYFYWSPETGYHIIGGASAGNGAGGQAAVSADGTVISGTLVDPASGYFTAGRYQVDTGTWTALGGLSGSCDASVSSGWGISGDGEYVVGLGWDGCDAFATIWDGSEAGVSLGSSNGQPTRANAANADGSVIAGWQDGNGRQGAVWVGQTQQLITLPDGSAAAEASAVSPSGEWVCGLGVGPLWGTGDTWRWNTQTQTVEEIPNMSGGERYMAGTGITDAGDMIVGGTWPFGLPASFGSAWVWRASHGTVPLTDLLIESDVMWPDGFNFTFISGISPDGRWITGWGNYGSAGDTRTWVVELPGGIIDCPQDLNGDGVVGVKDLLAVIAGWGSAAGDVNGDGNTDVSDILNLFEAWGECQ
ncbi:MAG: hypothetical protein MK101_00070 [Phycisphaerales bacterium]|nr:hypothetical protein [Phycisphaerales bacterium]